MEDKMYTRFYVILEGRGGELDRRTAVSEEDARDQARDIITGMYNLRDGDVIRVVAREEGE
jgi:hypothetical protein